MSLRHELSLFFGGLLLLSLSLLVAANFSSLKTTLEDGLKRQFSPRPFLQVLEAESKLLAERARTLEAHGPMRKFNRAVAETLGALEASQADSLLAQARAASPNATQLENDLYSLYDQALEVIKDVNPPHDLVVVADSTGRVLVELLGGVTYEEFAEPDFSIDVTAKTLNQESFWSLAAEAGASRGCLIYPDSGFYLYGANRFFKGSSGYQVSEGIGLIGTRIDRDFLVTSTGDALAFLSYGDHVVGTSEDVERWGKVLVNSHLSQEIPETWTSPDGKTYLIKWAALPSHYDEGLGSPEEVGRIFFLRDYAEVERAANSQARQSLLVGAIALIAALLLVPVVAHRFTGPIGTLSMAMNKVGQGELEQIPESEISTIKEVREASHSFNDMVIGLRQKKTLEAFVPEGTRQEVELSQGAMPELGGVRLERTIMFSDLRGFTSMSERLPADEVMGLINIYLHAMSKEIREQGGDINEYIGDAILAVFEDPNKAVQAARSMTQALAKLVAEATTEELKGMSQGIGLHTGDIIEGNIGEAGTRLKRAVVGDTVNLAARIQDRSRDGKHTCIFFSGSTKEKLTEEFDLVFFGEESFKGKAEPVAVWEVRS